MAKAFTLKNGTILLSTEAPGGLYNSAQLKKIAAICDGGTAVVKATEDQRIAMFVKEGEASKVAAELRAIGLGIRNYQDGLHQPITCIGELCADHEQDALGSAMELTQTLNEIALKGPLKIGINGCHRCCVPCHTFDISIIGDSAGYRISLGGKNSQIPEMASFVAEGVPHEKLAKLIRLIVELYQKSAQDGETLQDVMDRIGVGGFIAVLAPYSQDAAAGVDDPFGGRTETAKPAEIAKHVSATKPDHKSASETSLDDEIAVDDFPQDDVGDEITIGTSEHTDTDGEGDITIDEDMIIDDDFEAEILISEDHFAAQATKKTSSKKLDTSMVSDDVAMEQEAGAAQDNVGLLHEEEAIVMEAADELISDKGSFESDEDALALDTDDPDLGGEMDGQKETSQVEEQSFGEEESLVEESLVDEEIAAEEEPLLDEELALADDPVLVEDDEALMGDEGSVVEDSVIEDSVIEDSDIEDSDIDVMSIEEDPLMAEEELSLDDDALLVEEDLSVAEEELSLAEDTLLAGGDLTGEDLNIEDDAMVEENAACNAIQAQEELGMKPAASPGEQAEMALSYINEDPSQIEEDVDGQLESAVEETIREEQLSREEEQKDTNAKDRLAMMRSLHEEKTAQKRAIHAVSSAAGAPGALPKPHTTTRSSPSFKGVDFSDDGALILSFSSGMQLTVHPDMFDGESREWTIAGKTIRFYPQEGGSQIEIDGISMFLPHGLSRAG